ncbi:MAG: hypothetical protein ACYC0B_02235 [Gemmatimonadaceae bacterium]
MTIAAAIGAYLVGGIGTCILAARVKTGPPYSMSMTVLGLIAWPIFVGIALVVNAFRLAHRLILRLARGGRA